jgi:hypothetical protein
MAKLTLLNGLDQQTETEKTMEIYKRDWLKVRELYAMRKQRNELWESDKEIDQELGNKINRKIQRSGYEDVERRLIDLLYRFHVEMQFAENGDRFATANEMQGVRQAPFEYFSKDYPLAQAALQAMLEN